MGKRGLVGRWFLAMVMTTSIVGLSAVVTTGESSATTVNAPTLNATSASTCSLGNGVSHVIEITFDNVHFFRDNPNVPSDLELMPHLLNFIESNGTMLSNNHTPLIAHTADDILTNFTGLYGDRQGMGISNSYQTYNTDGTTDPGRLVRLLDRPGLRHRQDAQPRPRHQPVDGLLGHPAGHHHPGADSPTPSPRPPGCRSPGPGATSATCRRQHGPGEHRGRHPQGLRPGLPGGGPAGRPIPTRSRTPRRLTTSASGSTAPRAPRSARLRPGSSSARPARRRRRHPTCCRPSRAATTASRR